MIFLAGVLTTLILVWVFFKIQTNNFQDYINEAKIIKRDLEKLYQQSVKVADQIVNDLEKKINEGKETIEILEKANNSGYSRSKKIQTRPRNLKEKGILEKKLSSKQNSILQLADAGWSVKEISQSLGVDQDQVSMVLQLYKK